MKYYYPSGQIEEESHWNNGKRDGTLKQYLENGDLARELNFKNGLEI